MEWSLFFTYLAACVAPAAAGALFRPGDWYAGLKKPRWTPPDWLFPVIWAFLYVAMAVAAARIAALPLTGQALGLWTVQITINTLWSGVFFGLRKMALGGIVIAALWLALAATIVAFWAHDRIAALLLAPYLAWVTLALALNLSVWWLNRKTA